MERYHKRKHNYYSLFSLLLPPLEECNGEGRCSWRYNIKRTHTLKDNDKKKKDREGILVSFAVSMRVQVVIMRCKKKNRQF